MNRARASVVTSFLMAVTLLSLAVTTAAAMVAISNAQHRVAEARIVVTAYLNLQDAVAAEAFGEAGYRRAPDAAARQRIEDAVVAVDHGLEAARKVGDRQDGAVLSYLSMLNRRYIAEVRSTLDQPSSAPVDDRVAGPALDALERVLSAVTQEHREEVSAAVDQQADTMRRLAWVLGAVFLLAFCALAWMWRLMLAEHRRLSGQAQDSETRAMTDPLTGLANRSRLAQAMDAALAEGSSARSAVLFLDLDRFKPVNDTYGHHAGDLLLQAVAQRLLAVVRAGDLAARVGGDEFAIFLPGGNDAEVVAERILSAMELPFWVEGARVEIGVSIGIALVPEDGEDSATLLRRADEALYAAKRDGGQSLVFARTA